MIHEPDVATITDHDVLKDMWRAAGPDRRALIEARVAALDAADDLSRSALDYSGDDLDGAR